jgi:DNA polymerase III subunit delta
MVKRAASTVSKDVFLLVTGDEFLRRNKIESLLSELLPESLKQSHLTRIYPDELDWCSLISQAQTPTLLAGKQIFWLMQVDRIKKKTDWNLFGAYCDHPAQDVIFIFEADALAKSHPIVKLAGRFGAHVTFDARSAEQGLQMMREKVRHAHKQLTPNAWELLIDRLGGAPRLMDLCLDQLILYAEGNTIDEEAVSSLATNWLRYEPFDLTEALLEKNISRALTIFHHFYDLSGDVLANIGLIHWQLRRLWRAKKHLASGGRTADLPRLIRVPPFRLNQFLSQAKRFEIVAIERLIEDLWTMDWQLKRGIQQPSIAMESFIAGVR